MLHALMCKWYSQYFVDVVRKVRERHARATIFAGNVVTGEMVEELILTGADAVKIGIGPGSVCTTRRQTGVGYPPLSAVIECADAAHGLGGHVISDGGCKCPGDFAKAFGAGGDFVMAEACLLAMTKAGYRWWMTREKVQAVLWYVFNYCHGKAFWWCCKLPLFGRQGCHRPLSWPRRGDHCRPARWSPLSVHLRRGSEAKRASQAHDICSLHTAAESLFQCWKQQGFQQTGRERCGLRKWGAPARNSCA